jgi:Ca2+/Na+ antiporter
MLAKRILGVLMILAMSYVAYVKIDQELGNSEYAGFLVFLLLIALFLVFLAVRKIMIY